MLVTLTFPEYLTVFSTLCGKTSLKILHKYSIPANIAKARIDGLTNMILKTSKGRHDVQTALLIKQLAKNSAGDQNPIFAIQIKLCIETIKFFQQHIKAYENEIKKIMDQHCPIILSIPGISYVTGAIIIGEIGEISLFKSADKLLAFAGMDPCVYQSGTTLKFLSAALLICAGLSILQLRSLSIMTINFLITTLKNKGG